MLLDIARQLLALCRLPQFPLTPRACVGERVWLPLVREPGHAGEDSGNEPLPFRTRQPGGTTSPRRCTTSATGSDGVGRPSHRALIRQSGGRGFGSPRFSRFLRRRDERTKRGKRPVPLLLQVQRAHKAGVAFPAARGAPKRVTWPPSVPGRENRSPYAPHLGHALDVKAGSRRTTTMPSQSALERTCSRIRPASSRTAGRSVGASSPCLRRVASGSAPRRRSPASRAPWRSRRSFVPPCADVLLGLGQPDPPPPIRPRAPRGCSRRGPPWPRTRRGSRCAGAPPGRRALALPRTGAPASPPRCGRASPTPRRSPTAAA